MPRPTADVHLIDSAWPAFLGLVEADPGAAMEGLHDFAWRLLTTKPPRIFGMFSREEREDLIADLIVRCCGDNFRKLRMYRNVGKPFGAWLMTAAVFMAVDRVRGRRPIDELNDDLAGPADLAGCLDPTLRSMIWKCVGQLSTKCQLYLSCLSDGLKPREIAELLQLPGGQNKKVSDDLGYCKDRLREQLMKAGVVPEDAIP